MAEIDVAHRTGGQRGTVWGGLTRPLKGAARFLRHKPMGAFGAFVLVVTVASALLADVVAPYDPLETHLVKTLVSPSQEFLLGTDWLGRDLLSRIIFGARVSISLAIMVVIGGISVACVVGGVSGYVGGKIDLLLMRVVDAWLSFPLLVIALAVTAVFGRGLQTLVIALSIGIGMSSSRVVRSQVLALKEQQFILAGRAIGAGHLRILLIHMLPNLFPVLIILGTLASGGVILAEASLSFLGYGVPPPTPTWGGMLAGESLNQMYRSPWIVVWPGVALTAVVFSVNMLGDALRDVLDPRLRGSTLR